MAVLLVKDFEIGDFTPFTVTGTVAITQTNPISGTRSAQAITLANGGWSESRTDTSLPVVVPQVSMEANFRIDSYAGPNYHVQNLLSCGAIDATTMVDTSAIAYDFRFVVDSDNAGSVNYTTSFALVLVYHI